MLRPDALADDDEAPPGGDGPCGALDRPVRQRAPVDGDADPSLFAGAPASGRETPPSVRKAGLPLT